MVRSDLADHAVYLPELIRLSLLAQGAAVDVIWRRDQRLRAR